MWWRRIAPVSPGGPHADVGSLSPFDDALAALYAGEIARLRALIAEEPLLLHLRAEARPPLGYFSGATLLHHVAGNPGWNDMRGFGAAGRRSTTPPGRTRPR